MPCGHPNTKKGYGSKSRRWLPVNTDNLPATPSVKPDPNVISYIPLDLVGREGVCVVWVEQGLHIYHRLSPVVFTPILSDKR